MDFRTETERKFVVTGWSYSEVVNYLTTIATPRYMGHRHDIYWQAPGVDYIRLNTMTGEETVKQSIPGEDYVRIEESAHVTKEDVLAKQRMNQLLYGNPTLQLHRTVSTFTYAVTPAPDTYYMVELCAYQMEGDARVFFEVEGESMQAVDHFIDYELGAMTQAISRVSESIYTLFTRAAK